MKKLVVWSSAVVLLFSCVNSFAAAPKKAKRIKTGKKSVWVKHVSKLRVLNKNQRGARLEMGQGTNAAVNYTFKGKGEAGALKGMEVLQRRVERAINSAERRRLATSEKSTTHSEQPATRAEVPTRAQTAQRYELAKERSERENDPNILIREEVEVSFMRYKRDQFSEKLQAQVTQLRKQHTQPEFQTIVEYYDGLRKEEIQHHRTIETDILTRRINGDTHAQYEHQPEWNRHMDEMDRINEAEIEAWQQVDAK